MEALIVDSSVLFISAFTSISRTVLSFSGTSIYLKSLNKPTFNLLNDYKILSLTNTRENVKAAHIQTAMESVMIKVLNSTV